MNTNLNEEARMNARRAEMECIAKHIEDIVHMGSKYVQNVRIAYERPTKETIGNYSDWHRMYHHIVWGEEYFMVYNEDRLLYVVNVTGDARLTAARELIDRIAPKF